MFWVALPCLGWGFLELRPICGLILFSACSTLEFRNFGTFRFCGFSDFGVFALGVVFEVGIRRNLVEFGTFRVFVLGGFLDF